ncbi:hypothetical protein RhiJN_17758 [Ceratobasidium sp. AG-Ba]|nr:hypothetical protein RhiJN_17758 [Ceratobasidium sp. AG-Ba]
MASLNAVAGPSHVGGHAPPVPSQQASSSSAPLSLGSLAAYLPPDPVPPRPRSIIHPTQDLLGRYGIIPVYDEFVRPFNTPPTSVEDKGKRKEDGTVAATDGTDEARSGPKEGLFQHGYKHFIKDLGLGKHNHKKDTFLSDLVAAPEKPVVPITKLDRTTLIHAFRLKEGGVPGFNTSQLTGDDKERKKKKKKRPIDPTQPGSQAGTPTATPAIANPVNPTSVPAPIRRPAPPSSQLANGHVPTQMKPHLQAQSQTPTQQQRPLPQQQRHPLPPNPKTAARPPGAGTGVGAGAAPPSAKRKDREDGVSNGHVGGTIGGGVTGTGGLKPAKKRKMDPMAFAPGHHVHPHQAIQQPTPHY